MNKFREDLLGGTIVYFLGNVLVALLQLLILRIITVNISTTDYGYYNAIVTIDTVITPVLTLQISDAIFCFIAKTESKEEEEIIISSGFFVLLSGIIVGFVFLLGVNTFLYTIEDFCLVVLYIVSTNIFVVYQKLARAIKKSNIYVWGNLLRALGYIIIQVGFIYLTNMKGESLFLSSIISTFVCLIFMETKLKCLKRIKIQRFRPKTLANMLRFSLPLVPNTILWWLSGSLNQIIIVSYISTEANGIFTAAGKFSSLLSLVASVFNLSWQESAIRSYGKAESKVFYNETFETLFNGITSSLGVLIPSVYFILPYLTLNEYSEAVSYAPILLLGSGFSALYGFFGEIYAATGKTKGILVTTLVGVLSNLITVFLFIDKIGIWAPTIALVVSSFFILVMRFRHFKNIFNIKIYRKYILLLLFISFEIYSYYFLESIVNLFLGITSIIVFIIVNYGLFKDLIYIIAKKFRSKS